MKIVVILLGVLVAAHEYESLKLKMPDLNQLKNMVGGSLPQIPSGMKIEDLKSAFYNLPPSMKERLNKMAKSFGMRLDDVEDALNNPPPQLKDYFEKSAKKANVDTFKPQESKVETPEGGGIDMESILNNVDTDYIMKNTNVGDMLKGVNMQDILKNVDHGFIGNIMKNVDVNGFMKSVDLGVVESIIKKVDVGAILKHLDLSKLGDILKTVDINELLKSQEHGNIGDIFKNIDFGSMMKKIDLNVMAKMMENIDVDTLMGGVKDMNLTKVIDAVKEHIPDIDTLINWKNLAWEFLEKKGIPLNDPDAFMNFLQDKLKSLPLPKNYDAATLLNMAHGQLQAMGFPEDPTKIKDWLMVQAGHVGLKDMEDLKKSDVLSKVMMKKAFRMMNIDENSDPNKVKDRIKEQLLEEANKHGASLTKDSTTKEVIAQMDKVLSQYINHALGIETDSLHLESLRNAAMKKFEKMGFSVHDFSAIKEHMIDLVIKGLMDSGKVKKKHTEL